MKGVKLTTQHSDAYLPFAAEWSRIEPEEGRIDHDAIKHYHDIFDCLLRYDSYAPASWHPHVWMDVLPALNFQDWGLIQVIFTGCRNDLKPVVTLHHFVHPLWFDKKGGFTEDANIPYFVKFAEFAFK